MKLFVEAERRGLLTDEQRQDLEREFFKLGQQIDVSFTPEPSRFARLMVPALISAQYIVPAATSRASPCGSFKPVTTVSSLRPSRFARWILKAVEAVHHILPAAVWA